MKLWKSKVIKILLHENVDICGSDGKKVIIKIIGHTIVYNRSYMISLYE